MIRHPDTKDDYHWALRAACSVLVSQGHVYRLIDIYRSDCHGRPPSKSDLLFANTLEELRNRVLHDRVRYVPKAPSGEELTASELLNDLLQRR